MTNRKNHARVVAITGTSEYLGSQLLDLLDKDPKYQKVLSLDVREPAHLGPRSFHCPVDLTMPDARQEISEIFRDHEVDTLVHSAFLSHPIQDLNFAHELQVIGTMHLLNAAALARLKKVVMVGSTMSYGARPDNPNFLRESDPLRGADSSPLVKDLVEAEKQLQIYAKANPYSATCVLRMGCILGKHVDGFIPRLLSRICTPIVMGYDPLIQLLHETDALASLKLAIDKNVRGEFNIVADGVLPWTTILRLAGRVAMPVPRFLWNKIGSLLWTFQVLDAPPGLLDYLSYLWVADGNRARKELGFLPKYNTLQTLQSFISETSKGLLPAITHNQGIIQ
jgi:UDP-glucose 4-epimerase